MELTTAQLQAIKAYIDSQPTWAALPNNSDTAFFIADEMNKQATPSFVVWKKSVQTEEVGKTVSYVAVVSMTDANRGRITTFITMNPEEFEPTADIRQYWADTFSGTLGGAGQATRDALTALWKRTATVAEKVLATGTGSDASPATLGWEGRLTYQDVMKARSI